MILGLGIDLCDIRRIEALLEQFGDRFLEKVFSDEERAYIVSRPARLKAGTCAKRFAAKEACAKALGTGIAHGIQFKDLCVTSDPAGRPGMELRGRARARLDAMVPPGHSARIEISLTDEYPMAMAQVILHALIS